jgi:glycosyltransferase involved in cell wall biosynthesis
LANFTRCGQDIIFSFAYFLPCIKINNIPKLNSNSKFRFIFVGQFIKRKQLKLLIQTLAAINSREFELTVVGSGPLEDELHDFANKYLPGQINWLGVLPISRVASEVVQADCLVLPSYHDGWGAVITEALMVGTPVICSDSCGAAGVVKSSGFGGVFLSHDTEYFKNILQSQLNRGKLTFANRLYISNWAESLSAPAGAVYLLNILNSFEANATKPVPPWEATIQA